MLSFKINTKVKIDPRPNRMFGRYQKKIIKILPSVLLLVLVLVLLTWLPVLSVEAQSNRISQSDFDTSQVVTPPVQLAAGFAHSALIDYDGTLYLWGDNTYGQAGGDESYIDQPEPLKFKDRPIQVSLGTAHTLVLTDKGEVYSLGRNTFGQLGTASEEKSSLPVLVEGLPHIQAISAGAFHSLALAEDGSLWGWGNNTNGQLAGIESEDLQEDGITVARRTYVPSKIIDNGVVEIAAGGHFSLYLDDKGFVYSFGDNSKGQLGIGTTVEQNIPVQITNLTNIRSIRAGYEFALAVQETEQGDKLFSWGDNSLGQLGTGTSGGSGAMRSRPSEVVFTGLPLQEQTSIQQINAGYAHVLAALDEKALTQDSNEAESQVEQVFATGKQFLFTWGNNSFGQLAQSEESQVDRPITVNFNYEGSNYNTFLPFDALAAGGNHSLLMSSLGQLAASGRGNLGQLGNVAIIDHNSWTAIHTNDYILPAWAEGQQLKAEYVADKKMMYISWPEAQNNRQTTFYRLEINSLDGPVQVLECGENTERAVKNLAADQPLALTIFAYDEASADLTRDNLSRIYGLYLPEEYSLGQWQELFTQAHEGVLIEALPGQNWQPDPSGALPMPAVPWDQFDDYKNIIILEIPKEPLPLREIVLMLFFSFLIIGIAVRLALNYQQERYLFDPIPPIPESTKVKAKSAYSNMKIVFKSKVNLIRTSKSALAVKKAGTKIRDKLSVLGQKISQKIKSHLKNLLPSRKINDRQKDKSRKTDKNQK